MITVLSLLLIMPIFISHAQAQSEMPNPDPECALVDECLSPSTQTGSRVLYFLFLILIVLLLLVIFAILFLLYKSTTQKQH